jgi:hypothetical protein
MGYRKGSDERKVYSSEHLYKKKKHQRLQINSLLMHLKLLEKQEQVKFKATGWKEIIKK